LSVFWVVWRGHLPITKSTGNITYTYDPSGNRVSKTGPSGTTWYVRDAKGNTLAVYDNVGGTTNWKEQHLYGSSRVGMWTPALNVGSGSTADPAGEFGIVGKRFYELSNHLGNVLATVSDKRIQTGAGTPVTYLPDVINAQDYYGFGMIQPTRQFTATNASKYRYGFNGKENDNDVKLDASNNAIAGGQQDYGMRIYDPRVGKFLSVDPLAPRYPELTAYQFASNTPIQAIDLDGEEAKNVITGSVMRSPTQGEFVKQKRNDISFWKDQFLYEKQYSFKNLIDNNPNIRRQAMADASGGDVNMDYWEVKGTLPKGWTAKDIYNFIRKNLDSYMNYSVTTFGSQDPAMKKLWQSGDPTGAVMVFYPYAMDDSGVLTSKSGNNFWIFTPVWTKSDWRHPLAGHREFGLTEGKNGLFTFYTRAIDRMWTPQDAYYNYNDLIPLGGLLGNRNKFFNDDAVKTWGGLMDNVVKFINSLGGDAKRTTSFNKQVPWDTIKTN